MNIATPPRAQAPRADTAADTVGTDAGAADARGAATGSNAPWSPAEKARLEALVRLGLAARARVAALYDRSIHCLPYSLTYSVPLFLKRQCDRTPGAARRHGALGGEGRLARRGAHGGVGACRARQAGAKLGPRPSS